MSTPYSQLNTPERWEWHAKLYAFRRVVLGVDPELRSSPCDENGDWFAERLVEEAERELRQKHAAVALRCQKARPDYMPENDMRVEGRRIENEWAQKRGYKDFEAYKHAERLDHVEACKRLIATMPGPRGIPRESQPTGYIAVSARVHRLRDRINDPEALRKARIQLGIEPQRAAE